MSYALLRLGAVRTRGDATRMIAWLRLCTFPVHDRRGRRPRRPEKAGRAIGHGCCPSPPMTTCASCPSHAKNLPEADRCPAANTRWVSCEQGCTQEGRIKRDAVDVVPYEHVHCLCEQRGTQGGSYKGDKDMVLQPLCKPQKTCRNLKIFIFSS